MELTDLEVFLGVARHGSFSRAAAALRLAQPSVSARMAGLERTVGLELFARSSRGVALTAAGQALEPYARRCVALAEEGRRSARASAGVRRLVLAAPPSLAATVFPPLLAALAAERVEVTCRTAHSREVVGQLADGTAHAGFLLGTAVPAGITAERLYQVPIIAVARRDHPAAAAGGVRLAELADCRLAVHSWGAGARDLESLLRGAQVPPARVRWVSPASTALALAAGHDHIAVLPADTAAAELRRGTLARVRIADLPRWSLEVAVAWRDSFAADQSGRLAGIVRRALRQVGPELAR